MNTKEEREHPISIVELDGIKIVEYYGVEDIRNRGECALESKIDHVEDMYKTIKRKIPDSIFMTYDGKRFPVKFTVTMCNKGNTQLYIIERIDK